MSISKRLTELGIELPELPVPAGNYVNAVRTGNLLFLSGNAPTGGVFGKVGADISIDQAYQAAREIGLVSIAVMQHELGDLDRVKRIVKLFGMVNAVPDFQYGPKVINGCSDLFVEVFGDVGRHARSAVGMGSLPFQIPVEIECIVEVSD